MPNIDTEEDFLSEDPILPGQKFCILSFISPEKILKEKQIFFVEKFLKDYEIQWKTKYLEKYVADTVNSFNAKLDEAEKTFDIANNAEMVELCRKSRLRTDQFIMEYQATLEKNKKEITYTTIENDFKNFLFKHKSDLEDKFFAANDFHTTVRGIKVRGSYDTAKEAQLRAERLRKKFPRDNIFVGDVGKWLPWDPEPHEIADQDYGNKHLNQLMQKYTENEEKLDEFYSERNIARPDKKIHGIEGEGESAAAPQNMGDALFGTTGDLAIARKLDNTITIEPIPEGTSLTDSVRAQVTN
jgi:hypothetical protein